MNPVKSLNKTVKTLMGLNFTYNIINMSKQKIFSKDIFAQTSNGVNKKLIPLFTLTILLVFLVLPIIVEASGHPPINVVAILGRVQTVFFNIFNGLIIIMVVWAGFLYLTARGEPSKVTAANKALIWAVVGVAVGLLANTISGIVAWLVGI